MDGADENCIVKPLQKNVYSMETDNSRTCREDKTHLLSNFCGMIDN